MPNNLNKDRNKKVIDDEGEAAHTALISAQQRERRYRLRQLAKNQLAGGLSEGNLGSGTKGAQAEEEFTSPERRRVRSREELVEETRARKFFLQEEREQFEESLIRTPHAENQADEEAEGATNPPVEPGTPHSTVPSVTQSQGQVPLHHNTHNTQGKVGTSVGTGGTGALNPPRPTMAASKQKLPKFTGQTKEDPVRHCRTCETIWAANGVTDQDEWIRQFPATLREGAIDWYSDIDKTGLTTWDDVKKAFQIEFQLLRDDNEILAEIYNTKQAKNESVRAYGR